MTSSSFHWTWRSKLPTFVRLSKGCWRINYVKTEKCEFHAKSVSFLGYVIESEQVKTDPDKIRVVADLLTPAIMKQLQRFFGLVNFQRFMKNYNWVAASLTRLTSSSIHIFWSPEAEMWAILSQHSEPEQKLHPCAFFSKKLSTAQRNYDVGRRKLLVAKLALEEWRHWLEGKEQLFVVWTDHKNLEYIQSAKQLNSSPLVPVH